MLPSLRTRMCVRVCDPYNDHISPLIRFLSLQTAIPGQEVEMAIERKKAQQRDKEQGNK